MTDDQSPKTPSEFSERESPTKPGNPKPVALYDTAFLKEDDSVFSQAVRIVAAAANDINREREERRAHELSERESQQALRLQQDAILEAIRSTEKSVQQADRNSNTNYEMIRDEMKLLKQSDTNQDQEIAQLKKLPATMEERITALRDEILAKLPEALQQAIKPYADRLDALEREAREDHSAG